MSTRRTTIAAAALEVLSTGGLRSLTHREVDRVAGLPPGSTANLYGTRRELIAGLVESLERVDTASLRSDDPDFPPDDVEAVVDSLTDFAIATTRGALAVTTRARLTLLLAHPEMVAAAHDRAVGLLREMLAGPGLPDADVTAARVAAYLDGLALHAATMPEPGPDAAEIRSTLRRLIDAPPLTPPARTARGFG